MLKHFLTILLLLSCPNILYAQSPIGPNEVDEELTRNVDVTGQGKLNKISLHIRAKSMHSPFTWELSITANGKDIYTYASDDTEIDKFFGSKGYVKNCQGYVDCKKKYYFHDILDNLVLNGNKWYNLEGTLDKTQSNTLYPIGRNYLEKCCAISGTKADAILQNIENKLRNGTAIILNMVTSPVTARNPEVFAPEIGRFIPIYVD